jgi:hypothetical protein
MPSDVTGADNVSAIRALNDAFRKGDRPELGQVVMTNGVTELLSTSPFGFVMLNAKIQEFDAFDDANDPYGEHDFGSCEHRGRKVFWKIDYYDKTLESGSENPADPAITTRVLTIMLADEY